jgi:hypothetical protein
MRSSTIAMLFAGVGLAAATTGHADVLVRLRSGGTIRADRTWTEGDVVKVQMGTDVASFATSAIQAIEPAPGERAADGPGGSGVADSAPKPADARRHAAPGQPADRDTQASAARTKPAPAAPKVDKVESEGEDAATKLERLDALSMQTHRQLSIARRQGESADKLKALEENIDDINRQRADAMRKLGAAH